MPVSYPNGANKYVVGYTGLGFRGDATLERMNVKVIYIKRVFTAMGMEENSGVCKNENRGFRAKLWKHFRISK